MTIEEKLASANKIKVKLEKIKGQLTIIHGSRQKADKLRKDDGYPVLLKLHAWVSTGSRGSTLGDTYDSGIADRELLVQLFNAIEPILLAEKRALESELASLFAPTQL